MCEKPSPKLRTRRGHNLERLGRQRDNKMQKQMLDLTALAIAIMALIWVVAPRSAVTLNATGTDVTGIDILGLTNGTDEISAQKRTAHTVAP
jgi:hypothetical protein